MRIGAKALAINDTGSDRQHVLERPAKLNSDNIVRPIKSELRIAEALSKKTSKWLIGARDRKCGWETAHNFGCKAGA